MEISDTVGVEQLAQHLDVNAASLRSTIHKLKSKATQYKKNRKRDAHLLVELQESAFVLPTKRSKVLVYKHDK